MNADKPLEEQEGAHLYRCGNRRCRDHGRTESYGLSPSAFRFATGSFVSCPSCGQPMHWKGQEAAEKKGESA
jgi:hypothetical protein